jgi:hypothetical protein
MLLFLQLLILLCSTSHACSGVLPNFWGATGGLKEGRNKSIQIPYEKRAKEET